MRRWKDWLRQAKRKLDSARWDLQGEFFGDACFSAQQAAELGAKALLELKGIVKRGHSVLVFPEAIIYAESILGFVDEEVGKISTAR